MSAGVWVIGFGFAAASIVGTIYTALAAVLMIRFFRRTPDAARQTGMEVTQSVTVLKPLHGAERRLRHNLESFFIQEGPAPFEILFGVQDRSDPAIAVARDLISDFGAVHAELCVDERIYGQNRKVSNLINMGPKAQGGLLVLSDSDIEVPSDYLVRIQRALNAPGVGVVTCPYFGEPAEGFWSQIAAMGVSYQFLANVIAGVTLGIAKPCMGSTIALRRETLDQIGGFSAFSDVLADDYAIGAAVRAQGLRSDVAPVLVSHSCEEKTLGEVFAHELRWAKTVRAVDPGGHVGSFLTHPLPLAVIAAVFLRESLPAALLLGAAFCARVWLMSTVDRVIGRRLGPWWLIPLRDMLSFFVFVGSFFIRSVEWRGVKFHVSGDGDLKPV